MGEGGAGERKDDLGARHEMILKAIVLEYVSTAEPVGSEALAQRYPMGIKGASIRSTMSDLLELGILEQPHTSAGRIPSDFGYRYYVDHLIEPQALQPGSREVGRAVEPHDALSEMLRAALVALSRLTRQLAVGATIGNASLLARTAVVSALGPKQALLVLALSNGHVETRMIDCPADLTLEEIGKANDVLARFVVGSDLRTMMKLRLRGEEGTAEAALLNAVSASIRDAAALVSRGKVLIEGEPFVFAQPEFAGEAAGLATLIEELTSGEELAHALTARPAVQGSTVSIGHEHRHDRLHRFSVVRAGFTAGSNDAGVIAVIGPTRMPYEATMPLVETTAQVLSRSLARFFSTPNG